MTLDEATKLARDTLESQFSTGRLTPSEPAKLDGEPANRFRGSGDGRTVEILIALHDGKTWTLTLNGPTKGFSVQPLDAAIASWRWD